MTGANLTLQVNERASLWDDVAAEDSEDVSDCENIDTGERCGNAWFGRCRRFSGAGGCLWTAWNRGWRVFGAKYMSEKFDYDGLGGGDDVLCLSEIRVGVGHESIFEDRFHDL